MFGFFFGSNKADESLKVSGEKVYSQEEIKEIINLNQNLVNKIKTLEETIEKMHLAHIEEIMKLKPSHVSEIDDENNLDTEELKKYFNSVTKYISTTAKCE
uniref:Sporulation protein n=1 Tax=Rhabditophanes sp. KR3021 TaxID=114890 RepID=A0AC35TVM3_9BILA